MVKTTVYLPAELKARLARVAKAERRSEADLIRAAIDEFTAARTRPRPKLPLFASAAVIDVEAALRGFGED